MFEEDYDFLDQNAAVQDDDLSYDPNAEQQQWSTSPNDFNYDWSMPQQNFQQPQFDFNSNISNMPTPEWGQMEPIQLSGAEQQAAGMMPSSTNWNTNWDTSGIQNTLANLFNNKAFVSGIGALMEGSQNKKKAAMTQQMVRQMQPAMDPFGAQRGQYQQELTRTVQDPYSAPIVRDQVEQLKRAQAIKDAAAGRRSNSATTDPALMAAMAGVAQKYMDSLYTPAGANINPSGLSSLISAMQQGNNADVHGYISPLLSAVGYNAGNNTTNADIQAIKEKLGMK